MNYITSSVVTRLLQHTRFVQECKDAEPDVFLVSCPQVWRELFSPLHALNFGIAGDTTCNVLWRLQNGELENICPKVVVLWVGTNNYEHTAEQVAGGILAIAQLLTSRLPKAKIVVLGLLPRGERPNPLREKNTVVNGYLRSWLPRLGRAQLLDVSGDFVHSDGAISLQDMFDFLHLTATGYRTMAKPLRPWPSSTFIQRYVSPAAVGDGGDMSLVSRGGRALS
uniref:Platelet-activating factor acetylhydrolase IB subunit alpha2 n=1 Tax=Sander lucioperca TaxID=283035 RepID=A0A8D0AS40_SANLU